MQPQNNSLFRNRSFAQPGPMSNQISGQSVKLLDEQAAKFLLISVASCLNFTF